jgi:hypothetical protein
MIPRRIRPYQELSAFLLCRPFILVIFPITLLRPLRAGLSFLTFSGWFRIIFVVVIRCKRIVLGSLLLRYWFLLFARGCIFFIVGFLGRFRFCGIYVREIFIFELLDVR